MCTCENVACEAKTKLKTVKPKPFLAKNRNHQNVAFLGFIKPKRAYISVCSRSTIQVLPNFGRNFTGAGEKIKFWEDV
jgi:hypothetical protein